MGFSKKWSVTFTKHVKQKRKVYQDGTLELSLSGDKINLYDESENLIESKFVNKSEVIESGKTLTMVAHLVDIADCISGGNNSSKSNNQNTNGSTNQQKNENKKSLLQRKPLHKVSNLTQNNLQGSKKSESGAQSNNSTNSSQSILKEWNVLYTTQLTQKAKKYHDGTLRLLQLGSLAKQVQLFDEYERHLESKVLKKDEILESGKTILMVAHLIDIGDPTLKYKDNNNKDKPTIISRNDDEKEEKKSSFQRKPFQTASNVIKSSINEMNKSATAGDKSSQNSQQSVLKEWDVLYTTQKTQKAKKYHDGILRLTEVGTHAKQIVLISEEGNVLGSRFLKSIECVESGAKCELSNYLIEVCGTKGCGDSNKESSPSKSEALQKRGFASNEKKKVRKSPFQLASFKKSSEIGRNNTEIRNINTEIGNNNSYVKNSAHIFLPNNNTDQNNKRDVQVSLPKNNNSNVQISLPNKYSGKNSNVQISLQTNKTEEINKKNDENSKMSFTALQRDVCQILSILKRPMAESLGRQREPLTENTKLYSPNVQIDLKDQTERKDEAENEGEKVISGDISVEMRIKDNKSESSSFDLFDSPSFDLGF